MSQGENHPNEQANPGTSDPVSEPAAAEKAAEPAGAETPDLASQLAEVETKLGEA